jgi:DNA polymerase-3 subunit gamma/tau
VREVFGFETKIKHEACTKTPIEESVEEPKPLEDEPASMIEEAEIGGSASCVTNCQSSDSSREINGADILEEPMVQKATELFEATKRTVQLKI